MLSLLGLTFLPSAFEIDQGLEKFQNPYTPANCSRVRAPVASEVPAEEQGKVLLASVLGHFKSVYEK